LSHAIDAPLVLATTVTSIRVLLIVLFCGHCIA
jgi:hypothetical protein